MTQITECGPWVQGCSEWMCAKSKLGWKTYHIEFLFHCPSTTITQSEVFDWIKNQFYWAFCKTCSPNPRSTATFEQIPQLWLFPSWASNAKIWGRESPIDGGDERGYPGFPVRGIMMVPPRFNGCAADHIRKYRSEYINPVGIERIKIERVTNVPEVIASEVVKWSRTNPQSILILPVSPKELIAGKFLPHREEIKLISSFFRVSLDVARAQWLAIREQEALLIDARTAMIDEYACVFLEDPYDIEDPTIHDAVGYDAFCRRPESDIWVLVSQLPIHTQKLLSKRERIKGEWLLRETEKKS